VFGVLIDAALTHPDPDVTENLITLLWENPTYWYTAKVMSEQAERKQIEEQTKGVKS